MKVKTVIGVPPKAFLDTQIISDVERGHIGAGEWERALVYLKHATQYCISALTLSELLVGLANADPQYFEKHKRRLRVLLSPNPQAEVFDFVPYFVARKLGLAIQRPTHLEDDFLNTINLILSAPSKEALLGGFPLPRAKSQQTVKIRIDRLVQELTEIRSGYVKEMGYRQGRDIPKISPQDWAFNFLKFYGASGESDSSAKVAESLSRPTNLKWQLTHWREIQTSPSPEMHQTFMMDSSFATCVIQTLCS